MQAKILIVDDSRMVRVMVRETLEAAEHQVIEAEDGADALEKLDAVRPDLIVTDINMPRLDGLGLIRALRERPEHQLTPILVLSTEASDDIKRNGKDAGATGWLVKPFDPEQLRQTTRYVLQLREAARRRQGEQRS